MWQRYARAERFTAEEVSAPARWRVCCRLGGGAIRLDTTSALTLLSKFEVGAAGWIPDVRCCGDDGHMTTVGRGALSKTKAQLGTEVGRYVRKGQPPAIVVYLDIDQLAEPDGDSEHVNLEGP